MVCRSPQLRFRASSPRVLRLNGQRGNMSFTCRSLFFRSGARIDPTIAAVVADPVHCGGLVDHGCVVNVVDVGNVHVVYRSVVVELSVLPPATLITLAEVAVAVTDSAIEADLPPPVTLIEDVAISTPTPIGWSPEIARLRSHHPRTWHPVV